MTYAVKNRKVYSNSTKRNNVLKTLIHQRCYTLLSKPNCKSVVHFLCGIENGKAKSFGHDLSKLSTIFGYDTHLTKKFIFDDFVFDKDSYEQYRTAFMILDLVLLFESSHHSDAILNPNSNYSFNKIENLFNTIRNYKDVAYFKSFSAHLIKRCLQLQLQYVDTTDIFHKIFGLIVSFIRKHKCVVGNKSSMFINKIYECILATNFYGKMNKQSAEKYNQHYIRWIKHQLMSYPQVVPIGRGGYATIKMQTLCSGTIFSQFSRLCETVVSYAAKWKNGEKSDETFGAAYSKDQFLCKIKATITQLCDFGIHYWQGVEKLIPQKQSAAVKYIMDTCIFNYEFFHTFFQAIFCGINSFECGKDDSQKSENSKKIDHELWWKRTIWRLAFQHFHQKNMIKFGNYVHHWIRYCIITNLQLQVQQLMDSKKLFKDVFQLFSNSCNTRDLIQSLRLVYGKNVDLFQATNKYGSIPTPQMIKFILIVALSKDENENKQSDREYLISMSSVRKKWENWSTYYRLSLASSEYDHAKHSRRKKYCRRLTYAVCNIWEDIIQEKEYKYYLQSNHVFIKYNIPNQIVRLILDFKNSIVMLDGGDHDERELQQGETILIDTFGEYFDYYPKVLNWSVEERDSHIKYVSDMNQDVKQCWLDYFAKKKRFGQSIYNATIESQKTQKHVNSIVYEIISQNHTFRMSLFGNIANATYDLKNNCQKPRISS